MENKKFILAYAIYIGIVAFIIFFGKDFLNLTFLIFENLWNFFSAIEGVYYGIGIVLFCSLTIVCALLINLENKIVGILIFLLIVVWFYEALSEKEQNEFLHRIKKSKSTDPEEKIRELFDELNNDETVMLLKELNEKFKSFEEWQEIVKSINNIEA